MALVVKVRGKGQLASIYMYIDLHAHNSYTVFATMQDAQTNHFNHWYNVALFHGFLPTQLFERVIGSYKGMFKMVYISFPELSSAHFILCMFIEDTILFSGQPYI